MCVMHVLQLQQNELFLKNVNESQFKQYLN